MKYSLNEGELKIVKEAIDYIGDANSIINNKVECFYLVNIIENLLQSIDDLNEKYEDLERDLHDNYVHRPMSDYI